MSCDCKWIKELTEDDKFHDECGVLGVYAPGKNDISRLVYFGLHALQHRGQESAGIAANQGGKIQYYKEMGLVQEVFNDQIIERLQGEISIGHVRYSTTGESYVANAMPLVVYQKSGSIALSHNGNLVNAEEIRESLQDNGVIFQTTIDSEVFAGLIAKFSKDMNIEEAIIKTTEIVKGSYALVITCGNKMIGVRDPYGIRPLCIGKLEEEGSFVLSSESCAFSVMGAEFIRDVEPGEMVIIENGNITSKVFSQGEKRAICSFEYVYFARPDSVIDNMSVYVARNRAGRILAKEHPVEADMVIAVPDSGTVAAIGYAEASGIPFGEGLIKNRYIGRTFIQPDQRMRELSVKLKLNVLKQNVAGKRLVMIDDSIVRGTTSANIVRMLKDAGATEVHIRISSPPVINPCHFGIDTPSRESLVAANNSEEEIKDMIGADSLGYLSIDGLIDAIGLGDMNICKACFNGDYPMPVPENRSKNAFER